MRVCTSCGSSLPDQAPGGRWLCPYCGAENGVEGRMLHGAPAAATLNPKPAGRGAVWVARWRVLFMMIFLGLCVMYVGWEAGVWNDVAENSEALSALENLGSLREMWAGSLEDGPFANLKYLPGQVFGNLMRYIEGVIEIWSVY